MNEVAILVFIFRESASPMAKLIWTLSQPGGEKTEWGRKQERKMGGIETGLPLIKIGQNCAVIGPCSVCIFEKESREHVSISQNQVCIWIRFICINLHFALMKELILPQIKVGL